jgi:hypothetical protein
LGRVRATLVTVDRDRPLPWQRGGLMFADGLE